MNGILQRIREQIGRMNARLTLGQKIVAGTMLILLILGTTLLVYFGTRPDYQVLYSGLSQEDAGKIRERLKGDRIPYKLADQGTTVMVPADQLDELRLALAADGGPVGGNPGYRLFDGGSMFGMPEEIIQVNKRRVLEGELARSIESLDEVRGARVHLAIPPEALFVQDEKPVTASVILNVRAGATISPRQVKGIVNLVAGAVSKLDPDNVTVVDQSGKVLSQPRGDLLVEGSTTLEYQRNLERELEQKATEVLEKFVGPGKAVVRVRAKVDFSREQRVEELYDPERQVARSEETLTEQREAGGGRVGGAAGADANDPNAAQGVVRVGDASNSVREKSVTNYEISKTTRQVQGPNARIERLSVAVIVDGQYAAGAPGEEPAKAEYAARSAEEMATIRSLVAKAVEFDDRRGDAMEVANVRFHVEPMEQADAAMSAAARSALIDKAIRYGLVLLVALLLVFAVFRPLVRWLTAPPEAAEIVEEGGLPAAEQAMLPGQEAVKQLEAHEPSLLDRVRELAQQNPELAASVVRYWLKGRTPG